MAWYALSASDARSASRTSRAWAPSRSTSAKNAGHVVDPQPRRRSREVAGQVAEPDRRGRLLSLAGRPGRATARAPRRALAGELPLSQPYDVERGDAVARSDLAAVDAVVAEVLGGDQPGSRSR